MHLPVLHLLWMLAKSELSWIHLLEEELDQWDMALNLYHP